MQLSRNLKKILLIGSTVLMFTSVGTGTGNLTASAKRRYRPRAARRYRVRRYRHKATRRYRHHATRKHRRAKHFGLPSIKECAERNMVHDRKEDSRSPKYNARQARDAVKQINAYRKARGIRPYKENKKLDNIAMLRAKNMFMGKEAFDHCDKNGNGYAEEDAYKLGYIKNPTGDDFGENIADGYDNAKDANNDFMYHDGPDWGHRDNILGKGEDTSQVGAGYCNGYLVEEFD